MSGCPSRRTQTRVNRLGRWRGVGAKAYQIASKNFFTGPLAVAATLVYPPGLHKTPATPICFFLTPPHYLLTRLGVYYSLKMRVATAAFISGLLTVASAHFQLQYPPPRGVFVEDKEPTFCGRCHSTPTI